jgi:4-alpha-methyl-delta7-sterol-4alpha-methyl oxidase
VYVASWAFVAVAHHLQQRRAEIGPWTPERRAAFLRTSIIWFLSFAILELLVRVNPLGRFYDETPSVSRLMVESAAFVLLEDALYYWMHRAFHSSTWLYLRVHAYHHRSKADVSLVNGLQITFAELLLAIVLPGAAPLLLVPMQRRFFRLYSFVGLFGVLADHGLDVFPTFLQPFPLNGVRHHTLHHSVPRGNYAGPLAVWDFLCGTRITAA